MSHVYVGGIRLDLDGDCLKISGADVSANDFEAYISKESLKKALAELEKEDN